MGWEAAGERGSKKRARRERESWSPDGELRAEREGTDGRFSGVFLSDFSAKKCEPPHPGQPRLVTLGCAGGQPVWMFRRLTHLNERRGTATTTPTVSGNGCPATNCKPRAKVVCRHVRGPPANVSPIGHHSRKYTYTCHVGRHSPLQDRFPHSDRLGWGQMVGSKKMWTSDPTGALKFCQSSQLVQEAVLIVRHVRSLIV